MKRIKSLREHLSSTQLDENSLIQKGFAIGQRSRFLSKKNSLESKLSNLKSGLKSVQLNGNTEQQIKSLLTAFILLADILDDQAEMQTNIQNVVVGLCLLHEGTKK